MQLLVHKIVNFNYFLSAQIGDPFLQGEEERPNTKVFDEEDLEKERQDMVQRMEAKNRKTLQYKRSFFVRMVSDPKIYNPKINPKIKIKARGPCSAFTKCKQTAVILAKN